MQDIPISSDFDNIRASFTIPRISDEATFLGGERYVSADTDPVRLIAQYYFSDLFLYQLSIFWDIIPINFDFLTAQATALSIKRQLIVRKIIGKSIA
jgi:hypothetical protein